MVKSLKQNVTYGTYITYLTLRHLGNCTKHTIFIGFIDDYVMNGWTS